MEYVDVPERPRILITGASGFIGRRVLSALAAYSVDVIATARRHDEIAGQKIVGIDLDATGVDELTRRYATWSPTHLLHLAWPLARDFWHSHANLSAVTQSMRVCQAFLAAGGRHVIGVGSCAEYLPHLTGPLTESAATGGSTLYAAAKCATRLVAEAACRQAGMRFAWARLGYVYGAGEPPEKFISHVLATLRSSSALHIETPERRLSYVHVDDTARGLVRLLLDARAQGTFNLGLLPAPSLREIVGIAAGQTSPTSVTYGRAQGGDVLLDGSRMHALGWEPVCSLAAGIAGMRGAMEMLDPA